MMIDDQLQKSLIDFLYSVCSINRLSTENVRELLNLIKQSGTNISLSAENIAEMYNAKIVFRPGESIDFCSFNILKYTLLFEFLFFFFQNNNFNLLFDHFKMIHEYVIQCENKFVSEFGQSPKDFHRKALHKIYKSNLVVLMPVSNSIVISFYA